MPNIEMQILHKEAISTIPTLPHRWRVLGLTTLSPPSNLVETQALVRPPCEWLVCKQDYFTVIQITACLNNTNRNNQIKETSFSQLLGVVTSMLDLPQQHQRRGLPHRRGRSCQFLPARCMIQIKQEQYWGTIRTANALSQLLIGVLLAF
jgi:hypothetical protein